MGMKNYLEFNQKEAYCLRFKYKSSSNRDFYIKMPSFNIIWRRNADEFPKSLPNFARDCDNLAGNNLRGKVGNCDISYDKKGVEDNPEHLRKDKGKEKVTSATETRAR